MSERLEQIRERLDRWENSLVEVTPATMPVATDNLRYLLDRIEAQREVVEAAKALEDRWTDEDFDPRWDDRAPERRDVREALDQLEESDGPASED